MNNPALGSRIRSIRAFDRGVARCRTFKVAPTTPIMFSSLCPSADIGTTVGTIYRQSITFLQPCS
jgi:hypothetical protein